MLELMVTGLRELKVKGRRKWGMVSTWGGQRDRKGQGAKGQVGEEAAKIGETKGKR